MNGHEDLFPGAWRANMRSTKALVAAAVMLAPAIAAARFEAL